MFEWDESKRLRTIGERSLDFVDAAAVFDGRPVVHIPAMRGSEARVLSVGLLEGNYYTVVCGRGVAATAASFPSGDREMAKRSNIVRHTADELAAIRTRGESRTNWAKAALITRAQLEKSVATDPDEGAMTIDWENSAVEMPEPKVVLNMRVDRRVLDYFRKTGRGYQTRINAVLRAFVEAHEHRPR